MKLSAIFAFLAPIILVVVNGAALPVADTALMAYDERSVLDKRFQPSSWTHSTRLKNIMLHYHNAYRAHHGVPPLLWDKKLANAALSHARTCVYKHTSPYQYGENLAAGNPMNNPAWYVYAWYNEIRFYDFNKPGFAEDTGHLTQLLWLATTHVGCAWVTGCNDPKYLPNQLWCEYSPSGNAFPLVNFVNNVLPPKKGAPALPPVPPEMV